MSGCIRTRTMERKHMECWILALNFLIIVTSTRVFAFNTNTVVAHLASAAAGKGVSIDGGVQKVISTSENPPSSFRVKRQLPESWDTETGDLSNPAMDTLNPFYRILLNYGSDRTRSKRYLSLEPTQTFNIQQKVNILFILWCSTSRMFYSFSSSPLLFAIHIIFFPFLSKNYIISKLLVISENCS